MSAFGRRIGKNSYKITFTQVQKTLFFQISMIFSIKKFIQEWKMEINSFLT